MAKTVLHTLYGHGEIVLQDETHLTVRFARADVGEKRFLYPSAFASHLRYEDAADQTAVEAELDAIRQIKEAEAAAKEAEREALRLQAAEEAKQKKKELASTKAKARKKKE